MGKMTRLKSSLYNHASKILLSTVGLAITGAGLSSCDTGSSTNSDNETATIRYTETAINTEPTIQQAKEFLEQAARDITERNAYAARVQWINANFITDDTNWLAAQSGAQDALLSTRLANGAKAFNDLTLPPDMARKMDIIKRSRNFPAPERAGAAEELARISIDMDTAYGTGKFTYKDKTLSLYEATDIMATSRDPEELRAIWEGWRTISPKMKSDYARMVQIANDGSAELGYKDTGTLWRAGYDMPADDFTQEADRLWGQVKPLYDQLYCHVRTKLNENYGDDVVPLDQPMRADILGNMWGQSWSNIYDLVAPETDAAGVNTTALLEQNDYDAIKMVKTGEAFFSSLGFDPLPQTFWDRSLITRPRDRDVICHASAWNLDDKDDIRIKMCTKVTGEDFVTVHHELGHNYYQRAYKDQPVYYRNGANDGFHEAIGDMIALSITPEYLVKIGLLDEADKPGADADLALLMDQALNKVAFLPFGLMVDQWRWKVFSGEYGPEDYNRGWWELREKYQGLRAPGERPANAFDPGAKYHIPGNVPYMRYFLAHILQFQFHKAACDIAGFDGPLHRCSIYGNKDVGTQFNAMMELGAAKPWPDALEAFTGTREMDGSAIIEYFAPLMTYLEAQNEGKNCSW